MARDDPWAALTEALLGAPAYRPGDVAREAGLDEGEARLLWRALGFPPVPDEERIFTARDVEVLRAVRELLDVQHTHRDDLVQLTRVVGQSLARVADAQVSATAARLERDRDGGAAGLPTAEEITARVATLAPRLERLLGYVWRRHLLAALRRRAAVPSGMGRNLAVGFADLVNFTALSQALAPPELARIVDRFEAVAYEHIPERGGRVVKTIGDEVMFAGEDLPSVAEIALELSEAYARDRELPGVRVGLACGPTLAWEGDLYGPTVNLASRLAKLARANTVLISEEAGRTLRGDPRFELRHLRPIALQGIGRVRSWVLRRAVR